LKTSRIGGDRRESSENAEEAGETSAKAVLYGDLKTSRSGEIGANRRGDLVGTGPADDF